MKPFSQSCENNKDPILAVLQIALAEAREVLEIGSGTGQHACYFAGHLPHLRWQPTDRPEYLVGLQSWVDDYPGENLLDPVELDIRQPDWPVEIGDAVFTANTLHIMGFPAVETFFKRLGALAPVGNLLCVYGPFNYGGEYTSESNARFDQWLAQQSPDSAIRDFEAVDALAREAGYELEADHAMPANNRLLQWVRSRALS